MINYVLEGFNIFKDLLPLFFFGFCCAVVIALMFMIGIIAANYFYEKRTRKRRLKDKLEYESTEEGKLNKVMNEHIKKVDAENLRKFNEEHTPSKEIEKEDKQC